MNQLTKKTIISNINIPIPSRGHQLSDFKDIPTEWDFKKCKDVFSLEYGKGLKESKRNSGDYPVVGSAGIVGTHDKYCMIGKGIVVGRKGSAGLCTYLEKNYWAIDTTYYVEKKQNFNPKWLFFLLNILKLNRLSEGAVPGLNRNDVYQIYIPIPSIEEQHKIAKILSTVDNAIEKTDAIIKETQQLKKGLMQMLFAEGIGHTRFKETKIGRIPEEWKVKTFGTLIDEGVISKIQDGNHGEKHPKSSDYVNEGIPFILANNIVNGNLDLINCYFIRKEQADKLRIGFSYTNDVLLTHKGSVGNVAIVPPTNDYVMLTPQVTLYRISDENKLLRYFLKYYFENPSFQSTLKRLSMQSTRAYIGITAQKKLHIVLPQKSEQDKIINIIKSLDDKINNESETKLSLNALKKGLMQVLLTGKVRV